MDNGYKVRYYKNLKELLQKEEVVNYDWNAIICSREITLNIEGKEVPSRRYFWLHANDLQKFLLKVPKKDRNFHEVCRNGSPQKFFLDIDFEFRSVKHAENFDAITFLKPYINLINQFFVHIKERFVMPKDDLRGIIFESVSKNKKKISFHIIITGFYFFDIQYHKMFAEYIEKHFDIERKRVNPKLTKKVYTECQIDKPIYKKIFSLRMPGCTKKGEKEIRYKKFFAWFNIFDHFLRYKVYDGLFLDSLLTYVKKCVRYKFSMNSEIGKKFGRLEEPDHIEEDIKIPPNIMKIYEEFALKSDMDVMSYRETSMKGEVVFISLLRNNPSYCIVCKRKHHSENAYMIISKKGISYSCYRSNERYYINKNFEGVQEVANEDMITYDEPEKIMEEIEKRMGKFL